MTTEQLMQLTDTALIEYVLDDPTQTAEALELADRLQWAHTVLEELGGELMEVRAALNVALEDNE